MLLLLLLFLPLSTVLAFPQRKDQPKWFKHDDLKHGLHENLLDDMMEDMKRRAKEMMKPLELTKGGGDMLAALKPITIPSLPDIDIIKKSLPPTGKPQEKPKPTKPGEPRKGGGESRPDIDIIQQSVQHLPKTTSPTPVHTAGQKKPPSGGEASHGNEKQNSKDHSKASSKGEPGKEHTSTPDDLPSKKVVPNDRSKIPPPENSNGLTGRDLVKPVHSRAAGLHDIIPTNGLTAVDLEGAGQGTWLTNKGLFEGDIDLGEHTIDDYTKPKAEARKGVAYNAQRATTYKWPWAMVPYALQWDNSTEMNKDRRWLLAHALKEIEMKTCVRFTPRTTEIDYIYIGNIDGACHSMVGREGGRQEISLTDACLFVQGTVIHEFMHALGFWHEQSRADRDDYVHVNYDNVEPGRENNFDKYTLDSISHLGAPYDYGSLMHYSYHAFSKNGEPTIVPYPIQDQPIGQRAAMSDIDIKKINTYYNCEGFDMYENHDMQTTSTATPSYEPRTVPFFWDQAPDADDAGHEATKHKDGNKNSSAKKPTGKEEEKKPSKETEHIVVEYNGGSKNEPPAAGILPGLKKAAANVINFYIKMKK